MSRRTDAPRAALLWSGLSLTVLAWNTRAIDHFHLVRLSVTTATAIAAGAAMLLAYAWLQYRRAEANRWVASLALGVAAEAWLQFQSLPALPPALRSAMLLAALTGPMLAVAFAGHGRLLGRAGLALFTFATLFTASGMGLAWSRTSDVNWPQLRAPSVEASSAADAVDRVFLLLDESNADIFGPFIAEARARQLPILVSPTTPVGRDTAEVVPQWFSNHRGTNWRPCSATAACAPDAAIDFGRIHASQPDIDVVGFYFPYCAMKGLRSCVAPWTSWASTFDGRLCDWASTPVLRQFASAQRCADDAVASKRRLADDLLVAYWRLPFWQKGGLVLAHLPIPHPPNQHRAASLSEDYRSGVEKANEVAIDTLRRLEARRRPFKLVVFSDHPLRTSSWCARYWPGDPICATTATRTDVVPRIVVTDRDQTPPPTDPAVLSPIQ